MEKKNFYRLIVILFIPVFYIIVVSGFRSSSEEGYAEATGAAFTEVKDFLNVIFNVKYGGVPEQNWVERNLDMYGDSLNYNAIQIYDEGSDRFGIFDDPLTTSQITNVTQLMTDIGERDLKGIYARTKIFRLAEGQRLEYEVSSGGSATVNDGFCYQNVMSNTYTTDSGRTVLHAKPIPSSNPNSPGWLCSGIYENMQHSDYINGKDKGNWFLKPMMRIKENDFSSDDTTTVVKIDVMDIEGDLIKSVKIRVRNFGNSSFDYEGNYINIYNFQNDPGNNLEISGKDTINGLNYGNNGDINSCKVDFKIYWFGQVDVWFDKMIVNDEIANVLFDPRPGFNYDSLIYQEVTNFTDQPSNYTFYCDEAVYSQIPCLDYLKNKMHDYNPESRLSFVMSNTQNRYSLRNDAVAFDSALSRIKPKIFFTDPYLIPWEIPDNLDFPGAKRLSSSVYNDTLQRVLGSKNGVINQYDDSFIRCINITRNSLTENSPESEFFVIPQLFGHMVKSNSTGDFVKSGNREPTNEELQVQAFISISHGAEGLGWYVYQNTEWQSNILSISQTGGHHYLNNNLWTLPDDYTHYNFGLLNTDSTKRISSLTGQNKWEYVKAMNLKILHWKPTLDQIKWDNGYSVHHENADHKYISDIKSIIVHSEAATSCYSDNTNYDCPEDRYWEMGFFDPDFTNPSVSGNDKSKYFMMVNRRCVPEVNFDGDLRQLKIKFDSTQLSGFRNWKIIELDSNKVISTFDKNSGNYVDMGIFQPGEGRIYKLAPVMQEGGTLIADESINSVTFACNGDVDNNEKDISVYVGTNVNFANGIKWNIDGGDFKCGLYPESPNELKVNMKSQSGAFWSGINFIGCGEINIKNTNFENVIHTDTTILSALTFTDCHDLNIYNCKFNFSNLDLISCISLNYIESPGETEIESNILYNEFNTGSNTSTSVICAGYAESVIPLMLNGNIFNAVNGNIAVLLCNVSAGIIKKNTIQNYKTGINILSSASYVDIYNNVIIGDSSISGAQICDGTMNLGLQGSAQTGGFNVITSGNVNANNLNSHYGYFSIEYGLNTFNINNNSTAYHLGGIFPGESSTEANGAENCFKQSNSISTPRENVVCPGPYYGSSCDVEYSFDPTVCAIEQNEEFLIVDLGNEVYDTIFITGGGSGAGFSNKSESSEISEITSVKDLYNTICLEMRKRNFETVHTKCMQLISNNADSIQSLDGLSKLYLSSLILDRSGNKMSELKSFLESLILNHGDNEALVRKSYYLLQKTKVSLGLYQSAMSGFQQIINQNPFSYEGLTASWDYAATSLLDSMNGSGGGGKGNEELKIRNYELDKYESYNLFENENVFAYTLFDDPVEVEKRYSKINDDKKISNNSTYTNYTKEEKKLIKENILISFQTSRDKKFEKVKDLQSKIEDGKATEKEKSEFRSMKILSETVKAKKPHNIQEHLNFVNNDIRKVFGTQNSDNNKNIDSRKELIPMEYNLSQNYPNPFNPSTKINFSLPKEGKVNLIIYDILGREVRRLLNNEFKTAGIYSMDFNGAGLSSGVYFYKLTSETLSGGKEFSVTKRMVLLK